MKRLVFVILLLFFVWANLSVHAQQADYRIIPQPKEVTVDSLHVFTVYEGLSIAYDEAQADVARNAGFLQQWIEQATGLRLELRPSDKRAAIRMQLIRKGTAKKGQALVALTDQEKEAYSITVDKKGITLQAATAEGLFRAGQTLRKSLPVLKAGETALDRVDFPFVQIIDQPRFAYRGVLLDCARHFFDVTTIKQFLDAMALHGCNQFHWHLTDDQGWRFEVKALPELAKQGSVREQTVIGPGNMGIYDGVPYGGYYTQDDCREVVRYAAERYINVVPEIDLPGHMQGALHVFPQLGCTGGPYPVLTYWTISRDVLCGGNPETIRFLHTVLGELCDVFPSKYIHIGGDECPKDRWRKCEKCQAKIRELGLVDDGKHSPEDQLQTYINNQMEEFLSSRGRDLIGWNEILDGGLTERSIVMSWKGVKGGVEAARQHHRVIMSPNVYAYIDHPQLKDVAKQPRTTGSYIVSCSKMYSFEPVMPDELSEEEQQYILGVQTNLWTEHVAYPEHAFYQLLPRLGAMSEVQWCRPDQKDFEDFRARLPRLCKLYERFGYKYCRQVE
jgi:hexosaminidase